MSPTRDEVVQALRRVMDPELPTVSIVDLGMVGNITIDEEKVGVDLIPTFLGCPALDLIRQQVEAALKGWPAEVRFVHNKVWSSSMISAKGRQALTEWGVAPPADDPEASVPCPFCGSRHTGRSSDFGPSLCRSLYYCHDCSQPFERIKTI